MKRRITSIFLILTMLLSFISFADVSGTDKTVPKVYAYDFYFKDENSNILNVNASGDITAEVYAYLTDKELTSLDATLSVFVYYNNSIIDAKYADITLTKTPQFIITPAVTVPSDKVDNCLIKAYLTTKDFGTLLAPVAVLGSSTSMVEKITIGEYEIIPEDGIYEYNITRCFKSEELTPKLRAYTTDLSTVKEISSVDDNGVIKYTLKTTSCDTLKTEEYKINVTPLLADDTSLAGIEINGKTIKDFSPSKKEYTLAVIDGKLPSVTAFSFNSDAEIIVTDATTLPGTTTVKVSFENSQETYKINFIKPQEATLTADSPYPYLYFSGEKYGFASRNWFSAKRSSENMAQDSNYITYAEFPTSELGDIKLVGQAELSGKVDRYTLYEFYNTSYDTVSKDCTYDEFKNGSAKLLKSVQLSTDIVKDGVLTVEFDTSLMDIKSDGKIKIALVDGKSDGTIARFADKEAQTPVYLKIKYIPKNLSELSDGGFDNSLIEKPAKDGIVKGNASVTAKTEWTDANGITLSKITLDAFFPSECENKEVLVKVVKPNVNETDNKTLVDKYAYIYNTKTDSKGELKESFNLSSDAGLHTIVLSCNGYEKSINTKVLIPSADKMNELINGLKNGNYDNESLALFISSNIDGLSLSDSLYSKFSEITKKKVAQYIIDNIESYTVGGISEVLENGSVLLGINENETDDTVLKILETDEIADLILTNENHSDYINCNKNELISMLKSGTYNNFNDISDAVYENLFIIKLKECLDGDGITSVINSYRNYMSQNCYMKYNGMFEEDREVVNGKIFEKLSLIDSILTLEEVILLNLPEKLSVIEPAKTVHTYGFNFKNESNTSINEVGTSSKIKAEVYAELSDPKGNDIPALFTVMAYKNGKLISSNTKEYLITKDAKSISTDYINISEDGLTINAILTTSDMSNALSTVATLGSDNASIDEIYIGNYKLPLKENEYEYSLTRYFDENEAVKVRAYAKDFSAKIEITESDVEGIKTYTIKSVSSDNTKTEEYKINLNAINVTSTSLTGIEINDKAIENFSSTVKDYYVGIKGTVVPEINVYKFNSKAEILITDAVKIPGTTVIKVSNGEKTDTYNVHFLEVKNTYLNYLDFTCRTGNSSSNKESTIRATSEPLSGGGSKVLYFLFDLSELGNIAIKEYGISGVVDSNIKLYFYNSTYSSISEVNMSSEGNFKEINEGLVSYLGEHKYSKGENTVVNLDLANLKIKDNKIMIMIRKKYGDTNAEDYAQLYEGQLKLSFVEKPSANTVISEVSDKGFDISLLDKGELTYQASEGAEFKVDKKWTGENSKLKLSFNASFPKECANKNVYIKAVRPEVNESSQLSNFEKYAYINIFTLDKDGKLSEDIFFDEASGNYKFVLSCGNYETSLEREVYIPQKDKMATLLSNLSVGAYTNDTLYQYILDNKSDLALDNSNLLNVTVASAKTVCQYIIDNIEAYTVDAFNKALSEGLVIKGINSLESNQVVEKLLLEDSIYEKLIKDKNYPDYENLTDKTLIINNIKSQGFTNITDVKNAFYQNLLVVKAKSISSHLSLQSILNSYSDYIDVTIFGSYSGLTEDERSTVDKNVTLNLNQIYNITNLETRLKGEIDALNTPPLVPPVIITPTVGGGGGGLGTVTTPTPVIDAPKDMGFSDVPKDFWGYSYIKSLYDKQIISGKSETEFCPNDFVTRAEFTKMLVVALGMTGDSNNAVFYDISNDKWYYSYVNIGVANGIIKGMSEGYFEPDLNISRQDASVMINRILKLVKDTEEMFNDDSLIADYAKDSVYALKENGIINGYENSFNPVNNLTRAEAAVLISNILNITD